MRFRLKTLLLIVALTAVAATYVLAIRREPSYYRGYFAQEDRIKRHLSAVDPSVQSSGKGGHNSTNPKGFTAQYLHLLSSTQPITADLVRRLREQLLNDLANQGIPAEADLDILGKESSYPTSGVRMVTWGFQVLFQENGFKGVVTIRLTSKTIPGTESMGHLAELFENIVVFPRD